MHCKACDAPMGLTYMDELEQHPEILCDSCKKKAGIATDHDQYYYEGLWWDMHWTGKAEYDAMEWRGNESTRTA